MIRVGRERVPPKGVPYPVMRTPARVAQLGSLSFAVERVALPAVVCLVLRQPADVRNAFQNC